MVAIDLISDQYFMSKAVKEAEYAFDKGEVPIGAVIVYAGKIIAKAYNQIECLKDPTAHAEILAITQAAAVLRTKWLKECALYVTIEPCLMCAGALVLARIEKVVFGAPDLKTGAFESKLNVNDLRLNHQIKIKKGILEEDCRSIIQKFFKQKRNENISDCRSKLGEN